MFPIKNIGWFFSYREVDVRIPNPKPPKNEVENSLLKKARFENEEKASLQENPLESPNSLELENEEEVSSSLDKNAEINKSSESIIAVNGEGLKEDKTPTSLLDSSNDLRDDFKWVPAQLPVGIKMEVQIYSNLQLHRLGLFPLNVEGDARLDNHLCFFLNNRTDAIRSGCIKNYKANFEMVDPKNTAKGFKRIYTLSFPIPSAFGAKDIVNVIGGLLVTPAPGIAFKYVAGTLKVQGGKKTSGTY